MSNERYSVNNDGKIVDNLSGFIFPDIYWVNDLLNIKEDKINELVDFYENE